MSKKKDIIQDAIDAVPEPEDMDERQRMAWEFAKKLASQTIHDPSGQTSKKKTRSYSQLSRTDVEGYLASPSTNERNLRSASVYLYQTYTRYRNLINYYADIPCWAYTVSPVGFNPDKVRKENFKKQYQKVCSILESMGLEKTMREVVVTALREGVYYGCIWGANGDSFILQKLDPDNCTIVSITDGGVFEFVYDMSKINETDLSAYYPPQFAEMYREYTRTGKQYQKVPSEISVCFKADPTIIDYSIPVFSGVLPTLFQIKNIESLSEISAELSNYKLIAGKIPTDNNGVPLLDYKTAMQYYHHIANNVGDRVGVAITPFDLKDYSFEQSSATSQIDAVARANENFFAAAGTTSLLHGASNDTSGVTKLAIKVDEAFAFGLMYQCEHIINRFLKTLSGTIKFKIHFLDVSCFNRDEKLAEYKGAMNFGIGKLEFIAALGIRQHDIFGENYVESAILDIDNMFTPMRTASTQSADDNVGGRPLLDDGSISDGGEAARDGDTNANR